MWAKYKAVIFIWLSGGGLLGFSYYGYISGLLAEFEFSRLMYLTAFTFYFSTIALMVTVIKYKELGRLERNLNIEALKLSRSLMDQCEHLMKDNEALIIENHRLEQSKVQPIRTRKGD